MDNIYQLKAIKRYAKKGKDASKYSLVYIIDGVLEDDFKYTLDRFNIDKLTGTTLSLTTRLATTIPNIGVSYATGLFIEKGLSWIGINVDGFADFYTNLYTVSRIFEDTLYSIKYLTKKEYSPSLTMYLLPNSLPFLMYYGSKILSKKNKPTKD